MADLERLDTLAQRINREHRQVQAAFGKTLQHARRAGKLLVEAKERTPHGQWGPWLEANFEFTQRTAQNYMRVYSRWEEIQQNTKSNSDLTITSALGSLRAIAPPQEATITRERVEGPLQWPETIGLVQASPEGPEAGEEPVSR